MTLCRVLWQFVGGCRSLQAGGSLLPACVLVFAAQAAAALRILMVVGVRHAQRLASGQKQEAGDLC